MLPRVQRWLCLVAAPLALTVDAAGAQTAGSSMQAMPQKRQGMPDQVLSQGANMSASPERAANTEESGINVILKSDEPRVPMRDPKRGITMPGNTMADNDVYHQFLFDRFEAIRAPAATGLAWDMHGWIGKDINRLWLKLQGMRLFGKTEDAKVEALWGHAFAPFWDWQTGIRRDFGGGPARTWAAFGIQGLAPYWFDAEATLYVSNAGRVAARVRSTYDVRFSQRIVLTPEIEANAYAKTDEAREIGSGLADLRLGLRLRYEVLRDFAPYIGVVWGKKMGKTADFARAAGQSATDRQIIAGIRWWF